MIIYNILITINYFLHQENDLQTRSTLSRVVQGSKGFISKNLATRLKQEGLQLFIKYLSLHKSDMDKSI